MCLQHHRPTVTNVPRPRCCRGPRNSHSCCAWRCPSWVDIQCSISQSAPVPRCFQEQRLAMRQLNHEGRHCSRRYTLVDTDNETAPSHHSLPAVQPSSSRPHSSCPNAAVQLAELQRGSSSCRHSCKWAARTSVQSCSSGCSNKRVLGDHCGVWMSIIAPHLRSVFAGAAGSATSGT